MSTGLVTPGTVHLQNMRIYLSRLHALMAEELLHSSDVVTGAKQRRREGVAKPLSCRSCEVDSGLAGRFLESDSRRLLALSLVFFLPLFIL